MGNEADITIDPEVDLQSVSQILKGINVELKGELPVLGFAGSPMTLAFFLIAGRSPNQKIEVDIS